MSKSIDNGDLTDYDVEFGAGNVSADTQRITIATDDVNLAAIKTAVELLDNAISGSEMQVDIVNTPTVTANAGTGTFTVDGSGVTQPVSASSLPLPTGASTAANQSTANSSLSNIDSNTDRGVSSATESTGGVTTTSGEILASNASRKGGYVRNDTDTNVWISWGGTATTAAPHTLLKANGGSVSLVIDGVNCYTGSVRAIHGGSGTKNVTVVEV